MVIMILDTILSLLVDPTLTLVHSSMILGPLLSKDFSFFFDLAFQVVAQSLELILKLLLKLVDDVVDVIHTGDRELLVLLNLSICVIKSFFDLPFVFNSGILKHLESGTHILHLGLELG